MLTPANSLTVKQTFFGGYSSFVQHLRILFRDLGAMCKWFEC